MMLTVMTDIKLLITGCCTSNWNEFRAILMYEGQHVCTERRQLYPFSI